MATATVGILRVLFSGNSAEWEAAAKRASGTAQALSKDLGNIGRQATAIGGALTKTLTLPLLALGAGSVKAAMDFESSFANVAKTVDGVSDKTGKLTETGEALAKTFRQMAKEIPATTDELTKIAALGGQMGVPIEQLEAFTRNVAALGVAVDGISTEEAAAGLAQIGNITGDGATKIQQYASALVHLGNSSSATEGEILEFTKRMMGTGHAVGMTVPQVMALGTAMADVGIKAEAGATAMNTVIAKMSKAVSTGGAALEEFARVAQMSSEQFAESFKRSPIEAVDAFVKGLSKLKGEGVDLNVTMGDLGTEGIRVAAMLKGLAGAGDGVSKSLKTANEGFSDGNKHLDEAAKKYATTANQLKIFWNQVKDIGITIGGALLPAMQAAIQAVSALLPIVEFLSKAFAALPGPVQGVIAGLVLVLAATGPVIWAFGQLTTSASVLIGAFGKKGIAARLLAAALDTTATSTTAVGAASKTAAGGVTTFAGAVRAATAAFGTAAVVGAWLWALAETVRAVREMNELMREGNERIGAFRLSLSNLFSLPGMDKLPIIGGILQAMRGGGQPRTPIATKGPLATMPAYAADAEFATAVLQSQEMAAAKKALTTSAAGVQTLGDKLDALSASVKAADKEIAGLSATTKNQLTAAFKSGAFSIEELKKETGLSEIVLERFKKSLEASASSHKKAEKAASDQEKQLERLTRQLEKQRDALQKLGIVTEDTVNDALRDFMVLISSAGPGVPMDRLLAALVPKLEDLKKQADASGISVRALDENLRVAKDALARLTAEATKNIPSLAIVDGLSEIPGTMVQITTAGELMNTALIGSFHHFGLKTRAEIEQTSRDAIMHFKFLRDSGSASAVEIGAAYDKLIEILKSTGLSADEIKTKLEKAGVAVPAGKSLGEGIKIGLEQSAASIITTLGNALLAPASDTKWQEVGGSIGSSIGGAIGAYFGGPAGAALGQLLGGMVGSWLGRFFDTTDYEKRTRAAGQRLADIFTREFGTTLVVDPSKMGQGNLFIVWTEEGQKAIELLRRQFAALGIDIDDALRTRDPEWIQKVLDDGRARIEALNTSVGGLLAQLQNIGHGLPASLREYITGLEEAGVLTQENIDLLAQLAGDGETDWRKIQEAVERYGGDIAKLGGTFQAQRLHDSWQQIIDDMALFEAGGVSAGDALDLTKAKILELVNQSVKFGTEIPENMRPWIQRLIDSGELIDESGQKITDIGKLTFGETLQTSLEKLTDEIRRLILTLGGVPAAAQTAAQGAEKAFNDARPQLKVGIVYEDDGGPRRRGFDDVELAATGGVVGPFGIQYRAVGGMIDGSWKRGTDTVLAGLTPGEGVVNTLGMQELGIDGLHGLNHGMDLLRAGALTSGRSEWQPSALSREESRLLQSVTIMEVDKRELGRAVADVLPGELRRLGVRVRA